MRKTLFEIAKLAEGELVGDGKLVISDLCEIKDGKKGALTFLANPKYFSFAEKTLASAIITPRGMMVPGKSIIRTDNPSLAFAKVTVLFAESAIKHFKGIHKTAIIADDAQLGKDVAVGPYTVIEKNAKVSAGTIIYGGCTIGTAAKIGKSCLIYPNTTIREKIVIGDRVIIHSGAVIGADGFGFATEQGAHLKIPQMGTVEIGDDVEIGANVTIDRARLSKTVVGSGTKIDNLVHIAHNCIIGKNCLILAQAGISGSVTIGDGAILAGQAGIAGHLTIGEGAVVMAQGGVTKSIPPRATVSGYPAKEHETAKKVNAHLQRLPKYVETIQTMGKRIAELESKLKKSTLRRTPD